MGLDTEIARPAVLNKGLMICAGVAAVGFIASFFTTSMTKSYLAAQGMPPEAIAAASGGMTMVMAFIGMALNLLCLYFIAKGKNVARIIWLVLVVLGVLSVLISVAMVFKVSMVLGLFMLVFQLATLAGTVMMWLQPSSDWFKQMQEI